MLKFKDYRKNRILSGEVVALRRGREELDEANSSYVNFNMSNDIAPAFWNSEEEALSYLKRYYHQTEEEILRAFELVPVEDCVLRYMIDSSCRVGG